MKLKSFSFAGSIALAASLWTGAAFAQDYPAKPVTVIVPFAAGGPTDVAARIYGEYFARTLGQQFVVENAAGAGGTTGALRAARATPDGYTIFVHNVAPHVSGPALYPSATYDPVKNFEPIGTLAFAAHYIVLRKDFPAKDLKEFIAFAKANPGKINYGSAGGGSATHLACVLFGQQAGVELTHVPYRGTGPALNDLVAGTLDLMCDQGLNMMGQATAGGVKVLAVAQKSRFPGLPNVPTAAEAGLPGFEVSAATAMYAIAGTPAPVVAKLVETMAAAYKDPNVRKRIEDLASELPAGEQATPKGLAAFTASEMARLTDAIKKGGVKAQ
ncbi:MAG: Bug family tripartite tricarboxylate transporter substrate binding protein [Beijerinckiaceae bacterium]|jgi:tripartite-type tricarboxylate transporter receptor subunit TctC